MARRRYDRPGGGQRRRRRKLVTPAVQRRSAAPSPDHDQTPQHRGRSQHPNPPAPTGGSFPSLDGLGAAPPPPSGPPPRNLDGLARLLAGRPAEPEPVARRRLLERLRHLGHTDDDLAAAVAMIDDHCNAHCVDPRDVLRDLATLLDPARMEA